MRDCKRERERDRERRETTERDYKRAKEKRVTERD